MVEYADTTTCLRATILRYFGDPDVRAPCGGCANCCPGVLDHYERELVRKILAGIARAGERYGRNRIVAMLLGDTSDLPPALARISTTGLLRHETGHGLHGWIDACVTASLVVVSKDQYRTLSLTSEGRDVMHGQTRHLKLPRPVPLRPFSSFLDENDDGDDDDFDDDRLRRLFAPRDWGRQRRR